MVRSCTVKTKENITIERLHGQLNPSNENHMATPIFFRRILKQNSLKNKILSLASVQDHWLELMMFPKLKSFVTVNKSTNNPQLTCSLRR